MKQLKLQLYTFLKPGDVVIVTGFDQLEYRNWKQELGVLDCFPEFCRCHLLVWLVGYFFSTDIPLSKQIVYRTDTADITLQLRTDKPKPEDHPDLEFFKETIEIEAQKAQRQNAQKIAQVKKEIMVLEAHLVGLMQTDDGLEYVAEYEEKIQELTTKKPILSVKLK